jgi:hypothetical protein
MRLDWLTCRSFAQIPPISRVSQSPSPFQTPGHKDEKPTSPHFGRASRLFTCPALLPVSIQEPCLPRTSPTHSIIPYMGTRLLNVRWCLLGQLGAPPRCDPEPSFLGCIPAEISLGAVPCSLTWPEIRARCPVPALSLATFPEEAGESHGKLATSNEGAHMVPRGCTPCGAA